MKGKSSETDGNIASFVIASIFSLPFWAVLCVYLGTQVFKVQWLTNILVLFLMFGAPVLIIFTILEILFLVAAFYKCQHYFYPILVIYSLAVVFSDSFIYSAEYSSYGP